MASEISKNTHIYIAQDMTESREQNVHNNQNLLVHHNLSIRLRCLASHEAVNYKHMLFSFTVEQSKLSTPTDSPIEPDTTGSFANPACSCNDNPQDSPSGEY